MTDMDAEVEALRARVKPVMDAVRRDAQCDVSGGHPVGLLFNGADITTAAMLVVAQAQMDALRDARIYMCGNSQDQPRCADIGFTKDRMCNACRDLTTQLEPIEALIAHLEGEQRLEGLGGSEWNG